MSQTASKSIPSFLGSFIEIVLSGSVRIHSPETPRPNEPRAAATCWQPAVGASARLLAGPADEQGSNPLTRRRLTHRFTSPVFIGRAGAAFQQQPDDARLLL